MLNVQRWLYYNKTMFISLRGKGGGGGLENCTVEINEKKLRKKIIKIQPK